jgi:hypothetical protein
MCAAVAVQRRFHMVSGGEPLKKKSVCKWCKLSDQVAAFINSPRRRPVTDSEVDEVQAAIVCSPHESTRHAT